MRTLLAALAVLLALPAGAAAHDAFSAGEYEGVAAAGRTLTFHADPTGVHVFKTRATLLCADGETVSQRIWIPRIQLKIEAHEGRFSLVRRRGPDDVLRIRGSLSDTSGSGTFSRRKGSCRSGKRTWTAEYAGGGGHAHHGSWHGNEAAYPPVDRATARQLARADALRSATIASAPRFDTVAEANARGYIADPAITPVYVPGLVHYRKHGPDFWGEVLEPRRPQALIFWCPSSGDCVLAAFMYRAPAAPLPPTYGGLLGWHRHGERGHWMTHLWLTGDLAASMAQCAPFNALQQHNPLLVYEPYRADIPDVDEPCLDTAGYAP